MERTSMEEKGFTLIELIISLVIVGILAAVAYPSYTRFLSDSKVTEAQAVIGALAAAEKVARQQTGNFVAFAWTNNAWVTIGSVQVDTAEGPSFEYQINGIADNSSPADGIDDTFTITARGRGVDGLVGSGDTLAYSYDALHATIRATWSATGSISAP